MVQGSLAFVAANAVDMARLEPRTTSCGAAGYDFTTPAPYAVSTMSPLPAATEMAALRVASVLSSPSICAIPSPPLGASPPTPSSGPDDSCVNILAVIPGLEAQYLLTWNLNINPLCTNIDNMVPHLLCINPPYRSLEEVAIVTTAAAAAIQPPSTAIHRAANAKTESHEQCAGWYEVKTGDYCQLFPVNAIEVDYLFFLSPSVNDPACNNLWLEITYCDEADACLDFAQYIEVRLQKDQFQQPDVPSLIYLVNSCDFIVASNNFDLEDFLLWKPSLEGLDPCNLQPGLRRGRRRARRLHTNAFGGPGPVTLPGSTQPGIVTVCRTYYVVVVVVVVGGSGCWAIPNDHGISLDDLYSWNPALNGDCSGLWPDYACCFKRLTSSGPVAPPGPTQPGTIATCKAWHLVQHGQGCWDIQQLYGVPDFATLLLWSPALGSNCESLWPEYTICVSI
ncbi:hypothetical protein EsH8_XIV_000007 [Colletotrichum jinshuiense]